MSPSPLTRAPGCTLLLPELCQDLAEGVILLDPAGVVLDANRTVLAYHGLRRDDVVGRPFVDGAWMHGDAAAQREVAQLVALAAIGRYLRRQVIVGSGGGRPAIAVDFLLRPVRGEDGEIAAVIVEARDVSERLRLEQALREREVELSRAQRLARLGHWIWTIDGDRVHWSEEMLEIFGRVPGSAPPTYSEHATLYTPESWARLQTAVVRAIADGTPYRLELEFVRPDGTRGWIEAFGEAERDMPGRVVKLRGTAQDVSERHALQQATRHELEQARCLAAELQQRMEREREMLHFLAHEVRQPLHNASVALHSAGAALQAAGIGVGEQVRVPLEHAEQVLGHVIGALNNTLAAATLLIDTGGRQAFADTDLDVLVGMVLHDLAADERSRAEVEWRSPAHTVRLQHNLARLALFNLLANALAYSPPGSPVTLSIAASEEPLAVVFEVRDQGPGIPLALRPRLGERGARGANAAHRPGGGLGLYIVRQVAALHRGRLEVDSPSGGGTLARLTLPQGVDI